MTNERIENFKAAMKALTPEDIHDIADFYYPPDEHFDSPPYIEGQLQDLIDDEVDKNDLEYNGGLAKIGCGVRLPAIAVKILYSDPDDRGVCEYLNYKVVS